MKPKYLVLAVVLITTSCKVTEKDLAGFYKSKGLDFNTISLQSNHTFLYYHIDMVSLLVNYINIDSCHFITKGKWTFIKTRFFLTVTKALLPTQTGS